jgi:hypothetical protein
MRYVVLWLLTGWFHLVAMSYDAGTNTFHRESSLSGGIACIVLGPVMPLISSYLYLEIRYKDN